MDYDSYFKTFKCIVAAKIFLWFIFISNSFLDILSGYITINGSLVCNKSKIIFLSTIGLLCTTLNLLCWTIKSSKRGTHNVKSPLPYTKYIHSGFRFCLFYLSLAFFFFFFWVSFPICISSENNFSGSYGEEGTENILAANVPHASSHGAKKEETLNVVINMVKIQITIVIFYLY